MKSTVGASSVCARVGSALTRHTPKGYSRSRLAMVTGACTLALSIAGVLGTIPAAAAPAGPLGFLGVACPSSTHCEAVGWTGPGTGPGSQGLWAPVTSGVPGVFQLVSGTEFLDSAACPSATTCYAVGMNSSAPYPGTVVPITSGVAGSAQTVSGTGAFRAVACPTATTCEAVGESSSGQGTVVTINSGTLGSPQVVSGTVQFNGVACSTATTCEAVGTTSSLYGAGQGTVVTITGGTAGTSQVLSGSAGPLQGVACPTATTCEAVGISTSGQGELLAITSGTPGTAQVVPGTAQLLGVACPTAITCESVGSDSSNTVPVMVPVTNGAPGSPQTLSSAASLAAVACPSATTCYAVGSDGAGNGVVVTITLPGAPGQPAGVAEPSAVSLSWSAPSSPGSFPVSSYAVTPYIGAVAQTPINTGSTGTSYTVTGLTDGQAYTFTVAAVNGAGEGPASAASSAVTPTAPPPATYNALVPYRVCDTRPGNPSGLTGTDGQCNGLTLGPGQTLTIQVSGTNPSGTVTGGVPSSATSVVLNVTVTDTTAPSYLTVWPAGGALPLSSSVNWSAGQTVPNLVTVGLSSTGQVSLYNDAGNVDVVVDVEGWLDSSASSGGPYLPLQPYRICDTRAGNPSGLSGPNLTQCEGQTLHAGSTLTILAAGTNPSGTSSGGVPSSGTLAVELTVTVTDTSSPSDLTVWPAGTARPLASNLNFVAGETVANNVVVAVPQSGADAGKVSIYNDAGNADVVVDVSGYYESSLSGTGTFTPMVPYRICDTRSTSVSGLNDACTGKTLQAGVALALQVNGTGGIPAGATSAVLNVTVTDTSAPDFLTVYPDGTTKPFVSSLNWGPGETVASGVTATLGSDGAIDFYIPNGQADLVVDVVGWIGP